RCDHCGYQHLRFHSCRNRHCPKCQTNAREKWLRRRQQELLPVVLCGVPRYVLFDAGNSDPGGLLGALTPHKFLRTIEPLFIHLKEVRCVQSAIQLSRYGSSASIVAASRCACTLSST